MGLVRFDIFLFVVVFTVGQNVGVFFHNFCSQLDEFLFLEHKIGGYQWELQDRFKGAVLASLSTFLVEILENPK